MKQSVKDILIFLAMLFVAIIVGWRLSEILNHLIRGWYE